MILAPELRSADRTKVIFEGRKLLFFGGNDYHGTLGEAAGV